MITQCIQLKRCSLCNSNKTYVSPNGWEQWDIDKTTHLIICKKCYDKRYRQENKDKIREYQGIYQKENRRRIRKQQKIYRDKHKRQMREYRQKHKQEFHEYNLRCVTFKNKPVHLDSCPRRGQCSNCGRKAGVDGIQMTVIHHDEYHEDAPLRDTRELCNRCHGKEHMLIRRLELNRRCSLCHSDETYVNKNGCECWHIDKDVGLICQKCRGKKYYQEH